MIFFLYPKTTTPSPHTMPSKRTKYVSKGSPSNCKYLTRTKSGKCSYSKKARLSAIRKRLAKRTILSAGLKKYKK